MTMRLPVAGACLWLFAGALLADEGMWMPRQIPDLAPELKAAGMTLDPAKLADLTGDPMGQWSRSAAAPLRSSLRRA